VFLVFSVENGFQKCVSDSIDGEIYRWRWVLAAPVTLTQFENNCSRWNAV